jgi:hypothetical protein
VPEEADVFRRRAFIARRPLLRRPRILGAALIGGLGFAAGRASKPTQSPATPHPPDLTDSLKDLAAMHAAGQLTDEEFAAAKARLLES